MSSPVLLAIDLGTTGNRAILFDKDQNILAKAYQEFPQYFPQPGWVEHNPEEIWETTRSVIAQAIAESKLIPHKLFLLELPINEKPFSFGIKPRENQFTTLLCGNAVELPTGAQNESGRSRTFSSSADGAFSIRIFRERNCNGFWKNFLQNQNICVGTIDTWILWKLTGGKVHATEPGNASRTLLMNLARAEWDKDLLKFFGVPREMLPLIRPSDSYFGDIDPTLLVYQFLFVLFWEINKLLFCARMFCARNV